MLPACFSYMQSYHILYTIYYILYVLQFSNTGCTVYGFTLGDISSVIHEDITTEFFSCLGIIESVPLRISLVYPLEA